MTRPQSEAFAPLLGPHIFVLAQSYRQQSEALAPLLWQCHFSCSPAFRNFHTVQSCLPENFTLRCVCVSAQGPGQQGEALAPLCGTGSVVSCVVQLSESFTLCSPVFWRTSRFVVCVFQHKDQDSKVKHSHRFVALVASFLV